MSWEDEPVVVFALNVRFEYKVRPDWFEVHLKRVVPLSLVQWHMYMQDPVPLNLELMKWLMNESAYLCKIKAKYWLYSPIDLFSSKIISFVGSYCYSVDAHFDKNYEIRFNIFRYKSFICFSFMDQKELKMFA